MKHALITVISLLFATAVIASCTGAPAPGGTDTVNGKYFDSAADMKKKLELVQPGMAEEDVFKTLGCKREQLEKLDRNGIRRALFGGDTALPGTPEQQLEITQFLQESYGYKLDYKDVKRKHAFTSPIRIRTDENGFQYTITMVFHHGRLIEAPVLSGGVVNDQSSETIFDFLNPGTAIDLAK